MAPPAALARMTKQYFYLCCALSKGSVQHVNWWFAATIFAVRAVVVRLFARDSPNRCVRATGSCCYVNEVSVPSMVVVVLRLALAIIAVCQTSGVTSAADAPAEKSGPAAVAGVAAVSCRWCSFVFTHFPAARATTDS